MAVVARIIMIIVLVVILVLTIRVAKPFLKLPKLPWGNNKDTKED